MKRREFVNWVGFGVLASSLPVAIAACQSEDTASAPAEGDTATADAAPREDGFAAIGTVADLDAQGSLSDKTFQGEQVAVARNGEAIVAVNSLCTHQGCSVEWDGDASQFSCPCHGSKFNPDGSVAEGPATEPLPSYEAMIEGDQVLVKVG
ncbi:cytochrome B6 [filamentous cyanobacterium CCP5]|nr:cytochrome B6 [filamentous cyanobacterium CCP5]